jgi:hypothetical protein
MGDPLHEKRVDRLGIQRLEGEVARLSQPIGEKVTSTRSVDQYRILGQPALGAKIMNVTLGQSVGW